MDWKHYLQSIPKSKKLREHAGTRKGSCMLSHTQTERYLLDVEIEREYSQGYTGFSDIHAQRLVRRCVTSCKPVHKRLRSIDLTNRLIWTIAVSGIVKQTNFTYHRVNLYAVLCVYFDHIRISCLQGCKRGTEFGHDPANNTIELGRLTPVILVLSQDDFLARSPMIQFEWTGTVYDWGEGI